MFLSQKLACNKSRLFNTIQQLTAEQTQKGKIMMSSNTYVIYTQTNREQCIADLLNATILRTNPAAANRIYVPYRAKLLKRRDENGNRYLTEVRDILFPSYVFVESDDILLFNSILYQPNIATSYILLGKVNERPTNDLKSDSVIDKTDEGDQRTIYPVSVADMKRLHALMDGDNYVKVSHGIKAGRTVRFTDGPLVGRESEVSFIDMHRKFALLKIELFGEIREIKLAVDVVYENSAPSAVY